jgi:hypothetical protein
VNPTAEGLSWEVPVSFAQSYNLRGFRRDSQLTYDPTYTWTLSVSPRWNVRERVSLGARQDMTLELTESDITSRQRQVWLDDTRLDVRYTMEARPGDVTLTWLGLLRLPTSLVSQGARARSTWAVGCWPSARWTCSRGWSSMGWSPTAPGCPAVTWCAPAGVTPTRAI